MNYQGKEKIKMVLQGILMVGLLAYLFYNSILAVLFLSPLLLLFWKRKEIEKMKLQKWQLNLEFREALEGISAALCAGYSIENSFYEAKKDLSLIYKEEADIMWELTQITTQIQCNKRVEDLLYDFARRSHVEDILSFAEVFAMAKRSGGNLILILRQTVKNISAKIDMKREIQVMVAGKQMEAKIMSMVPLGIILYLRIFSPGYMDCLYHNMGGILVMSAALTLYLGGVYLSEKIMDIEV
ncbi:MAG: hypothetical protein RR906_01755 [Acetivibrio sp.]